MRLSFFFKGLISFFGALPWMLSMHTSLAQSGEHPPFDTQRRVLWDTSKIQGSPDPPTPYRTSAAFPKLKFDEPLAITSAPGKNQFWVAERFGKVLAFANHQKVEHADVVLELDNVIFGIALHPDFETNGYFYITYIVDPIKKNPLGARVSRFQVAPNEPTMQADPQSEKVILQWRSGGHNGGCLKFGPDGYLYIATGDSGEFDDDLHTGQNIANLSGAILRIDVDHQADGLAYRVPPDNPFVDTEGARPEIWAYGLRQPWKMSFDTTTGDLWLGNVGQDLWEQVFLIVRGGNYGWSVMEGSHPFRPDRQRGPTPFVPPVVEHNHTEFRSITGGCVYHGSRLDELRGSYIYGDYDTGKVWTLRYNRESKNVIEQQELVDSTLRVIDFAEDPTGELYLLDHVGGQIHQLEKNPQFGTQVDFPRQLSKTGLFESVKEHRVAAGVVPYSINAPQWMDGAAKEQFLALPGDSQIELDAMIYPQPAPDVPHGWKFPNGTVLLETISLEMEKGNPASRRRLETRILHFEKLSGSEAMGDQYWRGYTYVWNGQQTDAVLLEDRHGKDVPLVIKDPDSPGGQRTQSWHFPSRAECTVCHNMAAKYAVGVNTAQMNKDHDYGQTIANQLRTFEHLGLFAKPLPQAPENLTSLTDYTDSTKSINDRARSYLHANCAHCHRKWGGGNSDFRLLFTPALEELGIVDVQPVQGHFFIRSAKLVTPGEPFRSILLYRMAKLGSGRMPRLGSGVVDPSGLELIHDWIQHMTVEKTTPRQSDDDYQRQLQRWLTANSSKVRSEIIDSLLSDTSTAIRLSVSVGSQPFNDQLSEELIARATNHESAHIRDLFERYLPEEQRTKRLGNVIRPEDILAVEGNAQRGATLFFETSTVQCRNCHKIQGKGNAVGPDLSQIAKKYPDRSRLLDTVLNPAKEIDPKYRVYLVHDVRGRIHTGLLVQKDDREIVLKDAKNKITRLPTEDIEEMVAQQQSMMPDLLLRDMTQEQVADLLAFLGSLK